MRAVSGLAAALAVLALGACGGGGSDSGTTTPGDKTCQQDPTQAKCVVTTTTLRGLASAKGRSFGVSVDATFFGANPTAYDAVVAREFNLIVADNDMKWSSIHRDSRYTYRWTNPDSMVAFAQANGMKVRGHTLAWYQQNPTWLTTTTWDPETLKVVLKEHIDSVVGHYKGKVVAWDVVNEAFNDGNGSLRVTGSPGRRPSAPAYIELAFRKRAPRTRRRCSSTTTTTSRSPGEAGLGLRANQRHEVARRSDRRRRIPGALSGQRRRRPAFRRRRRSSRRSTASPRSGSRSTSRSSTSASARQARRPPSWPRRIRASRTSPRHVSPCRRAKRWSCGG